MSYTSLSKYILALVVAVFLASCGGGENQGEGQVTYLQVLTATPASFAQAPRSGPISVTFSDAIDAASVTTSSFQVTSSEGPLAGVTSVQGATITLTPNQPLAIGVRYTATVTTGIRSVAGHPLSAAITWQFDRGHKIAAGGEHICAILPDQQVKCWGKNDYGQLGLGDVLARGDAIRMGVALPAVDLGSGHKAVELAAGGAHTCALLDNGQIKCWGANYYGQLGLGDSRNRGAAAGEMGDALPTVDLGVGRTAKQIVAGGSYTCALLDNGLVKCWGSNDVGQLGLGDRDARGDEPGEMGDALPAVQLGSGRTAIAIAAGDSHTCALLDDGLIKCWGRNDFGQLGLGDTSMRGVAPSQMGNLLASVDLGIGRMAVDIVAGEFHNCALLDNGKLKCWGANWKWQLGLGDPVNRGDQSDHMGDALPSVDLGTGRSAQYIALGFEHTCALLDNGQVKCWGDNDWGQLGLEDTINRGMAPRQMGDNLPAVDLGTGQRALEIVLADSNTCAILNTGHIKCWGQRNTGLLGLGDGVVGNSPGELGDGLAALNLGTGRTATAITIADQHACALLDTGQVKCWGYNYYGQLGLGDTQSRGYLASDMGDALPAVQLGAGHTATSIAAGHDHTCALLDNGKVKCWGANWVGQLGLGDTVHRGGQSNQMGDALRSVDLGTGRSAQHIALSGRHTCALLDNGQVKCWGENEAGQLGLEDTISRGTTAGQMGNALPTINLGAGRTVLQVAAGLYHTCALLDTHQVKCWGNNEFGQLGLGDTATRGDEANEMGDALPVVDLGTGRTAIAIAARGVHTCALLDNGQIKCWGANSLGELGLGDTAARGDEPGEMGDALLSVDVGSHSVISVSAGWNQTCATLEGGQLKCWGYNADAQLARGIIPGQMGDNLPTIDVGSGRTVMGVAAYTWSTCTLLDNGQVKCWGTGGSLGLSVPANLIAVGDNPGEMGDALPTMNLGVPSEIPVVPARSLRPLSFH